MPYDSTLGGPGVGSDGRRDTLAVQIQGGRAPGGAAGAEPRPVRRWPAGRA